ncbi:putative porin [Flavobacteriaceae bacterium TP-CH-4]|uniref:Porin n=1 Tax=Pelagihabitans pacificus TaxID=2696054 RepID=A0A967E8N2_9FLAO|nr:putative porin [Pelagihabitans pacificus]NHF61459.1 putative porin [Pelagihabitans pacificus]
MKYLLLSVLFFLSMPLLAQEDSLPPGKKSGKAVRFGKTKPESNTRSEKEKEPEITIKDYKIISHARDTTFLDTTLTIQKEYKYNFLRRDDFELMPFANVGQPYNRLGLNFERWQMYPSLGAKAKHFNYFELQDINYYNVATPMTDIFFKTTFEQGQMLDAMLTFNTSRRLNFSIAYKGFRSLGKYRFNQAQSGNFRTTTNYESKNKRYSLRAHVTAQNIETEENGGLAFSEDQFVNGGSDFSDRAKLEIRFDNADNQVLGKRYFLDHQYKVLRKRKDSSITEKTSLAIGHEFNYETKYYVYSQEEQDDYYGDSFLTAINDKAILKTMYNQFNATFYNSVLGRLQGNISLYNYNYYFDSLLITEDELIENQLKGEEIAVGADYEKRIKGFDIEGSFRYTVSGKLTGTILDASAGYELNENNRFRVAIHSSANLPNFNFLLYQSDYRNYNWQNSDTFENERVSSLKFDLESKLLGNLTAKYTRLDNYAYFAPDFDTATEEQVTAGLDNAIIKPFQETNSVNYIKLKYFKEFRLGKFALANTLMYQNVSQTNQVVNLPEMVTRNTLYFSSDVFKKAMYIQTGVTFKYFSEYTMNAYNPVLGEFYIQNSEKFGGYPLLDFFINARVQQTRIYLKAEHFNSGFGETDNYFAAPDYPYRDFVIRFGLVWNFFS